MKAAWYEQVGEASMVLKVGDLPDPSPGPTEVLIDVRASGVNPSDVKARAGSRGGASKLAYPKVIPHSDGAGVVLTVGRDVRRFRPGDRVWVCNAQWMRPNGTAAQRLAIDESLVFPLPQNISFEAGASLGIPALTACHAALGFGSVAGRTVLVSGGGGTVGRLAVQMAAKAGAHVIATGRPKNDEERALSAGAAAFLDYAEPQLTGKVLAANQGRPIDHIVEVEYGANAQMTSDVIAPRGTLVAYGSARVLRPEIPFYTLLFKGVRLEFMLVYLLSAAERAAAAERVIGMLQAGTLDVPVHQVFPLSECAQAHQLVESGQRVGAVVVSCS